MREKGRAERRRQLCLKELVEEGDKDYNHVLSFSEFRHLLEPSYEPSRKSCLLGLERREDGAETRTGCNGCVCACGKLVCTSDNCSSSDGGKIGENMREPENGGEMGEKTREPKNGRKIGEKTREAENEREMGEQMKEAEEGNRETGRRRIGTRNFNGKGGKSEINIAFSKTEREVTIGRDDIEDDSKEVELLEEEAEEEEEDPEDDPDVQDIRWF